MITLNGTQPESGRIGVTKELICSAVGQEDASAKGQGLIRGRVYVAIKSLMLHKTKRDNMSRCLVVIVSLMFVPLVNQTVVRAHSCCVTLVHLV